MKPKTHITQIQCPKCGKEDDFCVWDRIAADKRDAVLSGKLFEYICPNCGARTMFLHDVLYTDSEESLAILFRPRGSTRDSKSAIRKVRGYSRKRIVRTLNQFKEKLIIFGEGLDDRIIELMKLYIMHRKMSS